LHLKQFMKVSFFKGIRDTAPFQVKDVGYYLDRIRNGKSKNAVTQLRLEVDKEKKKAIKQNLPVVCFGGDFLKRGNKYLKKSSGLLTLDFDKLADPIEFKNNINKRDFVFSSWISPSGDGVKVLIKIPNVDNDEQYKQFYSQINKEFPEADNSGKDIARACFESYDEDIYVNIEAVNYTINYEDVIFVEPDYNVGSITNIPVTDQDEIANKLMFGFKKYYDPKQRNNSLFKLACSFNSFGVNKITCVNYLESYQQNDFKPEEIKQLISSAYKKVSEFNTKRFENKSKKERLQNLVLSGKKDKEIEKEFEEINEDDLQKAIENIRESMTLDSFWRYRKDGNIDILPYRFKLYLESL